jgi:FkbM family methyltransferase
VRNSASMGHRRADRLRLALFHLGLLLSRALGLPRLPPMTVHLEPDGHSVMISDLGELSVLHDILIEHEYEAHGHPDVVFDLGANVGFATLYFTREHPAARIVAVEADPHTYRRLVRNVGRLPGVVALNRAVTVRDGPVTFFSSAGSSILSALERHSDEDQAVQVTGSTLETLMKETGVERIGLLKVDIEGGEFDLLRTAPLERVDEIIAEVHYDLIDADERVLRELLSGFELHFQKLRQPNRFRLAAHRPLAVPIDASGG